MNTSHILSPALFHSRFTAARDVGTLVIHPQMGELGNGGHLESQTHCLHPLSALKK